jgi:hypothetical protein
MLYWHRTPIHDADDIRGERKQLDLPVIESEPQDIPYGHPGTYTINDALFHVKPLANMPYVGTDVCYFLNKLKH